MSDNPEIPTYSEFFGAISLQQWASFNGVWAKLRITGLKIFSFLTTETVLC